MREDLRLYTAQWEVGCAQATVGIEAKRLEVGYRGTEERTEKRQGEDSNARSRRVALPGGLYHSC